MSTQRIQDRAPPHVLAAIAALACSMLMWEILLTRICALRLLFHFSYLVVSNCLLGIGASGALISVFQDRLRPHARGFVYGATLFYAAALVAAYAFLIEYPVPRTVMLGAEAGEGPLSAGSALFALWLYNLVAAVPFFFGGLAVGALLTFHAKDIHRVYGLDLLGAGLGCLLTPFTLAQVGAGGAFAVVTLLALVAALCMAERRHRAGLAALVLLTMLAVPAIDHTFPIPSKSAIQLTQDWQVKVQGRIRYSAWSAISRVDLVDLAPEDRYLVGLGVRARAELQVLPEQKVIDQDGDAGTGISRLSFHPENQQVIKRSLYHLASSLKQEPRVLVIGVGGGYDVWGAYLANASRIKGVELNSQILRIHSHVLRDYSRQLLEDPRVELVHGEGRNELLRDRALYDVVQMTGIDTWTSLSSGAYMLAENYLYTVEAVRAMYDRLDDGGLIQITRHGLDMEILRLTANVHAAHALAGKGRFDKSIAILSEGMFVTLLAKKGELTEAEVIAIGQLAAREGFVVMYAPGLPFPSRVTSFIQSKDKADFIASFPRDISPTYDDRPYFFNYTRFTDLGRARETIDEPSHVSQGNPLFILGHLALSLVLSTLLILGPVIAARRELSRAELPRLLGYFTGVGLGFILLEIVLIQKLQLFLGHPLYSITVTLFSVLVFTGLGSMLSERWLTRGLLRAYHVPLALLVLVLLVSTGYPLLLEHAVGLGLPLRMFIAVLLLSPLGLCLGIPFALGIELANRHNPSAVPWAWAVNACATVVGSILTVVLSMTLGFNAVMLISVAIYALAFLAARKLMVTG